MQIVMAMKKIIFKKIHIIFFAIPIIMIGVYNLWPDALCFEDRDITTIISASEHDLTGTQVNPTARSILESQEFRLLWTNNATPYTKILNSTDTLMVSTQSYLYLLDQNRLLRFDTESGSATAFRFLGGRVDAGATAQSLHLDGDRLYVVFDSTQRIVERMSCGASSLHAYELSDLSHLWSQSIPGFDTIDTLVTSTGLLQIIGSPTSVRYAVDKADGTIIELETDANLSPFNLVYTFWNEETTAYDIELDTVKAKANGKDRWSTKLSGFISQPPIVEKNTMIIQLGSLGRSSDVVGVSKSDGQLIWTQENVVSNVAIAQSIAYMMTTDGYLRAIDIDSGRLMAALQLVTDGIDTQFFHYQISAVANEVYILLGDSNQLLAFEFLPQQS